MISLGQTISLLLFAATTGVAAPENAPAAWTLSAAANRDQTLKVIRYSPTMERVAQLQFTPGKFRYAELALAVPPPLPDKASALNGRLTVEVMSPNPEAIVSLSLRLRDANGEIYQLMKPLELRRGIWQKVTFIFDHETRYPVIFGGDNNRKMDFPIRLWGVTVDFDQGFRDRGEIYIASPSWRTE